MAVNGMNQALVFRCDEEGADTVSLERSTHALPDLASVTPSNMVWSVHSELL
jgi:hypothetical protein